MVALLKKILGDASTRATKKFDPIIEDINSLEHDLEKLTVGQLFAKTAEFKDRLQDGEDLDDLLPEAFALVRESAKRTLGQRHYDVQLLGGIVLHQGKIAEMKTGEGKTLVATLPVYLNTLEGHGVHIITVNDYLAKRDPVWMGPVYHTLGLTVGCLQHDSAYMYDPSYEGDDPGLRHLRQVPRKEAYGADIIYGTNNEFGFDYLRDNMVVTSDMMVQRQLHYAIVDEVDNILIDEARTPLIISGPAEEPVELYYNFARLAPRLQEEDYTIDDRTRAIGLTQSGISNMERWAKVGNLYDPENYHMVHYIENALTAHVLKKRDKDYVVRDGEVVIVDEFTGRLQYGRRWSDGLHQSVEAKEGMKVQRESVTYATITLQNYFRLYEKLAGMTGTAATEAEEFYKIYHLDVVVIPTNQPMIRTDFSDVIFKTEQGKWNAAVTEIKELHQEGRPVLVGTTSIENSEKLSELLKRSSVPHQVLNAKLHEPESQVVAQAGRPYAVTVATNMAGRGTDIVLGGNPAGLDLDPDEWQRDHDLVISLGGLHVIGTEHHEARRVDNQLRGRCGRQGDPGSSRFYSSLEDDLMQRFGGERIKGIMSMVGLGDDMPIENRIVTKSLASAQVKVEGHHFESRKHLLEYDDVLNNQRQIAYTERRKALGDVELKGTILSMVNKEIKSVMARHLPAKNIENWNPEGFLEELSTVFAPPTEMNNPEVLASTGRGDIEANLEQYAQDLYAVREERMGSDDMRILERLLMLRTVDGHWVHHLTAMDNLRQGIGLHAVGQRDPLVMYKTEGSRMFQALLERIHHDIVHSFYNVTLSNSQSASGTVSRAKTSAMAAASGRQREAVAVGVRKTGRNEACPCGSGKKYKRCHGAT